MGTNRDCITIELKIIMSEAIETNGVLVISSLFRIGDHILIDKINTGWILDKYNNGNEITFKVEYELTKFIEEDVILDRIEVINIPNREMGNQTRQSTRLQQSDMVNSDRSRPNRINNTPSDTNDDNHPL